MLILPIPWPSVDCEHVRYRTCRLCGTAYRRVHVEFTSGSVAPTVGETLTGAVSGDYGVVTASGIHSGTYAGGDVEGWVELQSYSGLSESGNLFQAAETLNGSTGGADMATTLAVGSEKSYGIYYHEGDMVEEGGAWYCEPHWRFKYLPQRRDEWVADVEETSGED